MIPSTPLVLTIAVAAPILVLIVRVKAQRRAALLSANDTSGLLLESKAEPEPAFLLRGFPLPQRTYLGQQHAAARICFLWCAYILSVIACVGLLPEQLPSPAATAPQYVWQRFQDQLMVTGYAAEVLAFVMAVLVITTLKTPSYGIFNRTRPLSFRLLFWGRASLILASLLAATQTALLVSILLFTVVYGPVWKLASVQPGSILRLDLSMLTTTALVFSIFVFVSFIPLNWPMLGERKFIPIFLGCAVGSQAVFFARFLLKTPAARDLFLFPAQVPPNTYALAVVPLVCSAALLWFAERLSTRFEI